MNTNTPYSLMVVDDHPIFRKGLVSLLSHFADFKVVAEAENGQQAVALYRQLQPDLVLMDLQMPEMNGVEAVTQIRNEHPEAKIIILTTFDTDEDIDMALKAGAKSYLLKDVEEEQLLEGMRKVIMGKTYVSEQVAVKLAERLLQPKLTAREHAVLKLMAEKSMPNKQIAKELDIAEGTVKTHVVNIFKKLEVNSRSEAINIASSRGLVRLGK